MDIQIVAAGASALCIGMFALEWITYKRIAAMVVSLAFGLLFGAAAIKIAFGG